jgi:hypothetical protein
MNSETTVPSHKSEREAVHSNVYLIVVEARLATVVEESAAVLRAVAFCVHAVL